MRRIIGEHFKRNGRPKKPFETRQEAVAHAMRQKNQHAYYCHFCQRWHVATNRP